MSAGLIVEKLDTFLIHKALLLILMSFGIAPVLYNLYKNKVIKTYSVSYKK